MKSLRLHKYTDRLLGLTYDDLLTLTDRYEKQAQVSRVHRCHL